MTTPSSYLITRLEALRELLERTLTDSAAANPRAILGADWRRDHAPRLERYRARRDELRAQAPPTAPLSALALNPLDEDILLLAVAPALDHSFSQSLNQLRRSLSGDSLDADLALALLTPDLRSRLDALPRLEPTAPLIERGLLLVARPRRGGLGPLASTLSVPPHIQRELLGLGLTDGGAHWRLTPGDASGLDAIRLPEDAHSRLTAVLDAGDALLNWMSAPPLVLLSGASGTGKSALACGIAGHLRRPLVTINGLSLSARTHDPAQGLRDIVAEARRHHAVLLFDDAELLFGGRLQGNRSLPELLAVLDTMNDVVLLATGLEDLLDGALLRRVTLRVALSYPQVAHRRELWERALPEGLERDGDLDLDFIAEKYEFTGAQIQQAGALAGAWALARARRRGDQAGARDDTLAALRLCAQDIDEAAQSQIRHHLAELAVKSSNHLSLNDIVLNAELLQTLRSIVAAVRNRRRIFEAWGFGERLTTGRGLTMLFRGASGTGKTLSAEIVAAELAMPIYRVAIPRIVSKYIGETEQNLEKAFREAQIAQAILLFDEADAIFTKRVEVGTATDRYSNMEVNLLLQELERFEGVVILTTNLDAAIDDAFERRLNYKLDFAFPDAALRRRIWTRHLPERAPVELTDEDLDYLAERFELTGGSIKNVVVRAAYAAAEHERVIDVELLEQAAEQEYRELGKLVL